jgi:hypothetical protein
MYSDDLRDTLVSFSQVTPQHRCLPLLSLTLSACCWSDQVAVMSLEACPREARPLLVTPHAVTDTCVLVHGLAARGGVEVKQRQRFFIFHTTCRIGNIVQKLDTLHIYMQVTGPGATYLSAATETYMTIASADQHTHQ